MKNLLLITALLCSTIAHAQSVKGLIEERRRFGVTCGVSFIINGVQKNYANAVFCKYNKNKVVVWFLDGNQGQFVGNITDIQTNCRK